MYELTSSQLRRHPPIDESSGPGRPCNFLFTAQWHGVRLGTGADNANDADVIDVKDETKLIEVQIERIGNLFSSLDPSPFGSRDLNDDAEEFIVGWARELPHRAPIAILLHLPSVEAVRADEIGLDESVLHYFETRAEKYDRDLREHFFNSWRYLSIGVPLLTVCLVASQFAADVKPEALSRLIRESLIIVGWVANWKPIDAFLFGWWPIVRTRNLYRRLSDARVEIVAS